MSGPPPGAVPSQTPCNFLKGGGAGMFSVSCAKAVAKAGFAPEAFGSFEVVEREILAARAGASTLPADTAAWLAASRPGLLVPNAVFQDEPGNPCSNAPGAAGYAMEMAPAVALDGACRAPGTAQHEAAAAQLRTARALDPAGAASRPPGATLDEAGAAAIARATVSAAAGSTGPDPRGRAPAALETLARARARAAVRLAGADDVAGPAAGTQRATSGTAQERSVAAVTAGATGPAGAKVARPAGTTMEADEAQAAGECVEHAWKRGMDAMRETAAEAKNSEATLRARLEPRRPTPKQVAAAERKVEELAADPVRRTRAACVEHQANLLARHRARSGGALPPVTGHVPGAPRAPVGDGTSAAAGRRVV